MQSKEIKATEFWEESQLEQSCYKFSYTPIFKANIP